MLVEGKGVSFEGKGVLVEEKGVEGKGVLIN